MRRGVSPVLAHQASHDVEVSNHIEGAEGGGGGGVYLPLDDAGTFSSQ